MKIFSANSAGTPMPLSATPICHPPSGCPSAVIRITGVRSAARNLMALPMRFCHSMPSRVGSPITSGSGPGRSMTAPVSSITADRAVAAASRGSSSGTITRTSLARPTRENVSRSLIRICIRFAPSTANSMYLTPRSSSLSR